MIRKIQKKGEVTDVLIFMITAFVFGIGLFIFIYIIPQISNGLRNANLNQTAETRSAIDSLDTIATGTLNNGFMLVFVGLIIGVMISSFLVRTHPIFLFLYIFFLAITLLVGFYLGNTYDQLATNPVFANIYSNASFINMTMKYIAEITLAVGVLSMIIVFAKFSTFGGQQQY